MVVLNRIYTRKGDDGSTALVTGERLPKSHLRIWAYGTIDETNATVGMARLHTSGELDEVLARIIELKLGRIRERIAAHHKADFSWNAGLVEAVLARCTEVDSGARNVDHILNGTLLEDTASWDALSKRLKDAGA